METTYEGIPAISVKVVLDNFPIKPCEACWNCGPPGPQFWVEIERQNPNGGTECWLRTFGVWGGMYGLDSWFYIVPWIYFGNGSIELLNPGQPGIDTCCYFPLKFEGSTWEIKTWPVVSGNYKVELYKWIEDWTFCWWCYDCLKHKFCPWWGPEEHFVLVASHIKKITNQSNDFTALTNLYYVSADNQDTLYNGSTMEVMKEYDIVCQIHTTKRIEDIPTQLIGYLEPEDVAPPTQKIFYRDPAGDIPLPCNQNYPLRIHAYRCTDGFMPYELFPGIEPPEWAEITRYLDCKLYGNDNQAYNDIMMRTYVLSYLQLDCTNDSTVCFRPTACEEMEFEFRFGAELGLKPDDDIRFRITDKDDNTVYENPIIIPYMPPFENPFGVPNPAQPHSMRLFWDGRVNMGPNTGHLADPALDSYSAVVEVYEDENPDPIMTSNIETFDVVPTIDSVLVTHYPWYPPPDGGYIYIYSIIKGKVDDTDDPQTDYRYFIPNEEVLPGVIRFWDNESYKFHDLLPNVSPEYFYEDLNTPFNVDWWLNEYWGDISYRWYHVRDWGYKIGEDSYVGYEDRDTTAWWGSNWKATIVNNVDYKIGQGHPYMRLLVRSEVSNNKYGYTLNSAASPGSNEAHKIMMSRHWFIFIYDDIIFWAISQIGVPYYYGGKNPYAKMDCSGFVTAAKIQDMGIDANEYLRLGYINVQAYVNGWYLYPTLSDTVPTGTFHILPSEAFRGDLIAIRRVGSPMDWSLAHIGIIDWINADKESNYIYHANLIHARGSIESYRRRVRFDNLLEVYRPFLGGYNFWFGNNRWFYKFLRFTPEE